MENNKSKTKQKRIIPAPLSIRPTMKKTSKSEVKERTKVLGCNPRNSK